jgi:hypothetical protein
LTENEDGSLAGKITISGSETVFLIARRFSNPPRVALTSAFAVTLPAAVFALGPPDPARETSPIPCRLRPNRGIHFLQIPQERSFFNHPIQVSGINAD